MRLGRLTLKQVQVVSCPTCGSKAGEDCTVMLIKVVSCPVCGAVAGERCNMGALDWKGRWAAPKSIDSNDAKGRRDEFRLAIHTARKFKYSRIIDKLS